MESKVSTPQANAASPAMASPSGRALPNYVETAGNTLFGSMPLLPPFSFEGVTMMIFPFRANIARLTEFCASYLDINLKHDKRDQGDQLDVFKPAAPFVFMIVLKYGKMSSADSQAARNIGWIAQHEVTFTVPLEWWRWTGKKPGKGELKFQDWAIVSPFIFVDDFISQITGREVYGWPKVAGSLCADLDFKLHFPSSDTQILRFSTYTQPKFSQGKLTRQNLLLEINADPDPAFTGFPPQLSSPWMPWNIAAHAASSSIATLGTALDFGLGLGLRGYPRQRNRASFLLESSRVALRYASEATSGVLDPLWWLRLLPSGQSSSGAKRPALSHVNPTVQSITVKQFPDIERPHLACYQALVRSGTSIRRVNRAGLLGDLSLLRADLSGGYSVRIHQSALHPIVESLGLEVHRMDATPAGGSTYVLKPLLPYWCDVDTSYECGEVLYSQTLPPDQEAHSKTPHSSSSQPGSAPDDSRYFYNSIIGTAATPVSGPFHIPDMLIRVYPLSACPYRLSAYIDSLNNLQLKDGTTDAELVLLNIYGEHIRPPQSRPQPTKKTGQSDAGYSANAWAGTGAQHACVYLVCRGVDTIHGEVWADESSPDWLTDKSIEILIPTKLVNRNNPAKPEESQEIYISPYIFSNSARATISDFEVNGRPTKKVVISDSYDDPNGEMVYRPYVHTDVRLESFSDVGGGQKASLNLLIEIDSASKDLMSAHPGRQSVSPTPVVPSDSGDQLYHSQPELQKFCTLKCSYLAEQGDSKRQQDSAGEGGCSLPVHLLGLKQYRDSEDPTKSCYQSIVLRHSSYQVRVWDYIEDTVRIRIHHAECHPIVETLGLADPSSAMYSSQTQGLLHELEPLRPFWVRAKATENLGSIIARRNVVADHARRNGSHADAGQEPPSPWTHINLKPFAMAARSASAPSPAPSEYQAGQGRPSEASLDNEPKGQVDYTCTLSQINLLSNHHGVRREGDNTSQPC